MNAGGSTGRRYAVEFGTAMAAYVVTVVLSAVLVEALAGSPWRYVVAVAPVVPAVGATWAVLRHARRIDELARRIQFEALAFAAPATGLVTFTWGFLELAGAPHIPWIWVFPLLIGLWGIGNLMASRRYR